MKRTHCLLSGLMIVWCSVAQAEPTPVVVREVANPPTFVVLPASENGLQTRYAESLEALLLELNLRVFRRPALKHIEETRRAEAAPNTGPGEATVLSKQLTESYYEFETITAEYVLFAFQEPNGPGYVDVVHRASKELLASFKSSGGLLVGGKKDRFASALHAIGILKVAPKKVPPIKQRFVARSDVKEHPVFVVLPAVNYAEQAALANQVQTLLQLLSLRVNVAPGSKIVSEKKSVGILTAEANRSLEGAQQSRTEVYELIDTTGIDYLIETNSEKGRRVRIFTGTTNELIGAVDLSKFNREAAERYNKKRLAFGIPNDDLDGSTLRMLVSLRYKFEQIGVLPPLN